MKTTIIAFLVLMASNLASAPGLKAQTKLEKIEATVWLAAHDPEATKIYMAIIWNESEYNHNAYNLNTDGSYDFGVAQLNSRYWNPDKKYYGVNIRTMRGNVYAGAKFFVSLINTFPGNIRAAVTAYNCGAGAVMRGMVPASSKKYADRVLQMAAKSDIYNKALPVVDR